jgi:hypothetical protein
MKDKLQSRPLENIYCFNQVAFVVPSIRYSNVKFTLLSPCGYEEPIILAYCDDARWNSGSIKGYHPVDGWMGGWVDGWMDLNATILKTGASDVSILLMSQACVLLFLRHRQRY